MVQKRRAKSAIFLSGCMSFLFAGGAHAALTCLVDSGYSNSGNDPVLGTSYGVQCDIGYDTYAWIDCPGEGLKECYGRYRAAADGTGIVCHDSGTVLSGTPQYCRGDGGGGGVDNDDGGHSPILIDVDGRGYRLTDLDGGVEFDLSATGLPQRVAWTDPHRGNAFLVLDRNGDGLINDGTELFGDVTWQQESNDPNGFRALALFDINGDGRIDAEDLVFSQLRLWIDSSHDGISQPRELFTLRDFWITAIYLDYRVTNRRDRFGNLLRYMSFADVEGRGRRPIYDVFFAAGSK